jgi:hypothetical protein
MSSSFKGHNSQTAAKAFAEIMLAHSRKETIQSRPAVNAECKNHHPWKDDDEPSWQWCDMEYRVKPKKPQEWYICFRRSNPWVPYLVSADGEKGFASDVEKMILVREVIE